MQSSSVTLIEPLAEGAPGPEHFLIKKETMEDLSLEEGQVLVQLKCISADPYLRGRIKPSGEFKAGATMSGFVSGKVIASNNSKWKENDLFGAALPFTTVQKVFPERNLMWRLDGLAEENISYGIGVLGMPGSTAYGGLIDVLRPLEGETIFISAASGAVGQLVGQLAKKLYGCRVIGSCGGPRKCALLLEKFGFDYAIDYKTCPDKDAIVAELKRCAPEGIDMYFENVGGIHFEAAMECLRPYGRVAVCGAISEYKDKVPKGQAFQPLNLIYKFQRIEGFMCMPWLSGKKGNFHAEMPQYLSDPARPLVVEETFFDGIESWAVGFNALFTGANLGKVVVRV
jgi:NADPH-dependent curcumin reductase CurA